MFKIIISFLLLLNVQNFSQDFLKLFRQHIPDNIMIDQILSNSLNMNLKRNAYLNPELLYFTLQYYQQYDGNKFDTKLFEVLKMNERVWFLKRNEWVNSTLEKINQTVDHDIIFNSEIPLTDLITEVRGKENDILTKLENKEKQLSDFYIVKFYNNNSEMKFEDKTDYSQIRNQIEESKQQYFREVKANPALLSTPAEIVNNVVDNWYLMLEDKELDASDIIITCLDDMLLDKGRKKYSISFGGVFVNNTIDFEEKLNFPGINHTVTLNKTSSLPQLSLGIGYKLFFDKRSYFLSYVDIQAFYSLGYSEVFEEYPVAYTNEEVTSTYTIDETLRNFNDDYKLSSLNSYGLKLAVPVYELDFLVLEAALSLNMNSYTFKPDMHFTYSKYKTNVGPPVTRETLALGALTLQEEKVKKYFSIIPMIDATFRIDSKFGVKFNFSYNYMVMNLHYATALFF